MKSIILFLLTSSCFATTSVYLRSDNSGQFQVTGTATVTSTIQIATRLAHGLSVDNIVGISNVCGTTAANGNFKVKAVQDTTHFTIKDKDSGADIALNSAWCTGTSGGFSGGPQWGGRLTQYSLPDGPKGGPFDGWSGKITRGYTIRPANGLTSLTVASNVVTAVLSFTPDLLVGMKLGIWGTSSTALNDGGNPWTIATIVGTTMTLTSGTAGAVVNGTYTTNNACGTSGTANCVSLSERVYHGAPWYDGNSGFDAKTSCANAEIYLDFAHIKSCAAIQLANPANTVGLSTAQDRLRKLDQVMQYSAGTIWATESFRNGGNASWADFGSYSMYDAAMVYAVYQADWLTPTERQYVADVMLNDISDPGGCTKNLATLETGTVTISGSAVTGSGTTFTSYAVDDMVIEQSIIDLSSGEPSAFVYKITAIADNTHMTVVKFQVDSFSSTPAHFYRMKRWVSGMCGGIWAKRYWDGGSLGHPTTYPPAGTFGYYPGPYRGGSNNLFTETWGLMAMAASLVDQDTRAVRLFEQQQAWWFDQLLPYMIGNHTGFTQSGNGYSYRRTSVEGLHAAFHLTQLVPTFPDLGFFSGPYAKGILEQLQYILLPDNGGNADITAASFGTAGDGVFSNNVSDTPIINSSPFMTFFPDATESKYYFDFLSSTGRQNAWLNSSYSDRGLTWMDNQRQTRVTYTNQPLQYYFHNPNQSTCTSITGNAWCYNTGADAFISRTGWSNPNDTHLMFLSLAFYPDHDKQEFGSIRVYKRGTLLGWGSNNPGGDFVLGSSYDTMLSLSAGTQYTFDADSLQIMLAPMTKWAAAGNSTLNYGDASSRYAFSCIDNAQLFSIQPTFAMRCAVHFKKTGTEEMVFQVDRVDNTNLAGQASFGIHWIQTTTCPGGGGCASLNTNRHVETAESGTAPAIYGLGTTFMSPGTITVRWDDNTYGVDAISHRATVCGGSSCGGTSNTLESVVVHKINTITGGLTITTSDVYKDSAHYVVAADDKVLGTARGTSLVTFYPSMTIPSGITQMLFTDLATGTYTGTLNGSSIGGCTVVANDNSCYLEPNSVAGTFVLSSGATPTTSITGKRLTGNRIVIK